MKATGIIFIISMIGLITFYSCNTKDIDALMARIALLENQTTSVDTVYVSTTDTLFVHTIDTLLLSSVDTVYLSSIDTIYVSSTDTLFLETTLIITKIDSIFVMDTVWMIGNDTIMFGSLTLNGQQDVNVFGQTNIRHMVGGLTLVGNVSDLTPLSNLRSIESLTINSQDLLSLDGLDLSLSHLQRLDLRCRNLVDITALSSYSNTISMLTLYLCNKLTSLDGLQNITGFGQIDITYNNLLAGFCAIKDSGYTDNEDWTVNNNAYNPQSIAEIAAVCN